MTRSGARFDTVVVVLTAVLVAGGYLLVWADSRGLVSGNQIFSVWAALLYVGFVPAVYLLFLWWSGARGARRSGSAAYRLSFLGSLLFLAGLVIDFLLRTVVDRPDTAPGGVLSPSRLALFAGAALMLTGPIFSIIARRQAASDNSPSLRSPSVPTLTMAIGTALAILMLLTGFIHPIVTPVLGESLELIEHTPADLYLVPTDGTGSRHLTSTAELFETFPDVSPDGTSVAFGRGANDEYRIHVVDVAGGEATTVTNGTTSEEDPAWSPDGSTISLWANLEAANETTSPPPTPQGPAPAPGFGGKNAAVDRSGVGIWTVQVGQPDSLRPLRDEGGEGIESWAPDGTQACGWSYVGGGFEIARWDLVSLDKTTVIGGPGEAWACSWSPAGSRLAFHSDRDGDFEIYTVAPDGSNLVQITDDDGIDQLPSWSSDGSQIAFVSTRAGDFDIYVAAADGSTPRNLTSDPGLDDGFYGVDWLADDSAIVASSSGRPYAEPSPDQSLVLGIAGIVIQSLILVGGLMFALRAAPRVIGAGTAVALLPALLLAFVAPQPVLAVSVLAAGIAADVVAWLWRARPRRMTLAVGVAAPTAFVATLFLTAALTRGLSWSLDLVIGTTMLVAILGFGATLAISSRTEVRLLDDGEVT